MSSTREADYLVDYLVPRGYVLAAVAYPLSNIGAPGGPTVNDVLNQPGDLSFLINTLLARNAHGDDALYGLIDASRIAAVGLSLVGLTTQLVAFHREVHDPRVATAVSIAGPSAFLEPAFFRSTDVPFMMVAGSADAIIPCPAHAAPIPDKVPDAILMTLYGGSHVGFASIATTTLRWLRHPARLLCPLLMRGLQNGDPGAESIRVADAALGIPDTEVEPCAMENWQRQRMQAYLASGFVSENLRTGVN